MSTVMSSPGLLFLLLVSSCLLVLSTPPGTSFDEGQLEQKPQQNQSRATFTKFGTWMKKNFRGVGEVLVNSIEPVPVAGPAIAGVIKTLLLLAPQADALNVVNSELKALSVKLDSFRAEMKWDAWAAGAYQMPVNNIEKAWIEYTELVHGYYQTTNTEKEAFKNFFTFYSQYADSTLILHQFLTAKPVSVTRNLGNLLADRLRCHEKDIKAQFLYLNKVMCKGNMLNEKYYEFKGTNTNASAYTAHQIASQSASALITSHQRCISDSAAYIEMDIFEHIDDTKNHQELADNIRAFLAKTYDRYDWMIVAFTTHNSKHKPKFLKRHALSGFTEVERGTVTVAVAKQVKGGHTKTAAVVEAIKKCLPERFEICLDVAQKLMECKETVFGRSLSQTYTAVHTFSKNSQTSTNEVEAPNDDDSELPESSVSLKADSSLTPHLFTGQCGNIFGKFIVFIKSDEEIMGVDPCPTKNCGQNGKCVVVSGTLIAMCECQYPYYGEHCEMSLESYKRELQRDTERRSQTPERFLKGMSTPTIPRSWQNPFQHSSNDRSQQSTSRDSAGHGSQQSTSRDSAGHGSQQRTSQHSSNDRSQQSTSRDSAGHGSQQRTSQHSSNDRSQQSTSRDSAGGGSQQQTQRNSTLGRVNSVSKQHTPGRSTNKKG